PGSRCRDHDRRRRRLGDAGVYPGNGAGVKLKSGPLSRPARMRHHRATALGLGTATPPGRPSATRAMKDVTCILTAIEQGDPHAAAQLLPLVYDELRELAAARLADEKSGQTLQPTALVHEAYLRLVGGGPPREWNGRGHFFAAAAEAMRRILINRARDRHRLKRAGDR